MFATTETSPPATESFDSASTNVSDSRIGCDPPSPEDYLPLLKKVVARYAKYHRHADYLDHLGQAFIILAKLVARWEWETQGRKGFAAAIYHNVPLELNKFWQRGNPESAISGRYLRKDRCGRDKPFEEVAILCTGDNVWLLPDGRQEEANYDDKEFARILLLKAPWDIAEEIKAIRRGETNAMSGRTRRYVRFQINLHLGTAMVPSKLSPNAKCIMDVFEEISCCSRWTAQRKNGTRKA